MMVTCISKYQSDLVGTTKIAAFLLYLAVVGVAFTVNSATASAEDAKPLILHVKTAMSVDDAQICVVPNIAWAALAKKRSVIIVFDGSAVTSVAKGFGWRGWVGGSSTAMDRADLPERERKSLAEQLGVRLDKVPHNYGEYLSLIKEKGANIYYNATMALLYKIPPEKIDPSLTSISLNEMLDILDTPGTYLVY